MATSRPLGPRSSTQLERVNLRLRPLHPSISGCLRTNWQHADAAMDACQHALAFRCSRIGRTGRNFQVGACLRSAGEGEHLDFLGVVADLPVEVRRVRR